MVGNDDGNGGAAVGDDRVERAGQGEIGVHDGVAGEPEARRPGPTRRGGRVERPRVVDHGAGVIVGPGDDLGRARHDHDR